MKPVYLPNVNRRNFDVNAFGNIHRLNRVANYVHPLFPQGIIDVNHAGRIILWAIRWEDETPDWYKLASVQMMGEWAVYFFPDDDTEPEELDGNW